MTKQKIKRRRRWIIGITVLVIILFGGNLFRNYWLEHLLHRDIAKWVNKASDGLYDISFNSLDIGFFSGNLTITDVKLYPDSSTIAKLKLEHKLPDEYFFVSFDKFSLSGINLLWLLDYRKLHFKDLSLLNPDIKVISPALEFRKKNIDSAKDEKADEEMTISNAMQEEEKNSIYDYIKPHFDYIKIDEVKLKNANVSYSLEGVDEKQYKLDDFNFVLKYFNIDENTPNNHQLLYSDSFELLTLKPQIIYESNIFQLKINDITLNTRDSIAFINGINFATKQPYWDSRYNMPGEWLNFDVNKVEFNGVNFARINGENRLTANKFLLKGPEIDYSKVISKLEKHSKVEKIKDNKQRKVDSVNWSLYDMVTPIFGYLNIDTIQLSEADLNFNKTQLSTSVTDTYKFEDLNVLAESFNLNLNNKKIVFFDYFDNLSLNVDSVWGHVPSKNNELLIDNMLLDTKKQDFRVTNIYLKPILQNKNNNYIWGKIKEVSVVGLIYEEGISADSINVISPTVNFTVNKIQRKKTKPEEEIENKHQSINEILSSIAPYIDYINIRSVEIVDGEFVVNDNVGKNKYTLHNLDFKAQNFEIDTDMNILKDYALAWKDYQISFSRFNNMTPDKKYRVKIDRGSFNSTTGNLLFKKLSINPIEKNDSSYMKINIDYAKLLGFNQNEIKNKKILFESLVLENPSIEIIKEKSNYKKANQKEVPDNNAFTILPFTNIKFNTLAVTNPDIYYSDNEQKKQIKLNVKNIIADNFDWQIGSSFKVNSLSIDSPYVFSQVKYKADAVERNEQDSLNINTEISPLQFDDILIGKLNVNNSKLILDKHDMFMEVQAQNYGMMQLELSTKEQSFFKLDTLKFYHSNIALKKDKEDVVLGQNKRKEKKNKIDLQYKHALDFRRLREVFTSYTNETTINFLDITDFNLLYEQKEKDGRIIKQKLNETNFFIKKLNVNKIFDKLNIDDIGFSTRDYFTLVNNGFYTLGAKYINLNKNRGILEMDSISFVSNFPKFDFAYLQPEHKDWFNVNVEKVKLMGIDFEKYFKSSDVMIDTLFVDNIMLQNYKNQKIYTPPKLVPLLYEVFDNVPINYYVNYLDITRFTVFYQELFDKGYIPGQIAFADMYGSVKGFTNIPQAQRKFYKLYAGGLAFGTAPFKATWTMPIQTSTDLFYTWAKIDPFDVRVLNKLIEPMAPASVKSGNVSDIEFDISATTLGARVKLKMIYDDLYFVVDKNINDRKENLLFTKIVNDLVIKQSNEEGKHFRLPTDTIVRNPYHSNFNYFWQILMPPSIQALGISKEKQNFAKKTMGLFKDISTLLPLKKKGNEEKEE